MSFEYYRPMLRWVDADYMPTARHGCVGCLMISVRDFDLDAARHSCHSFAWFIKELRQRLEMAGLREPHDFNYNENVGIRGMICRFSTEEALVISKIVL